jgi:hypothetical protein
VLERHHVSRKPQAVCISSLSSEATLRPVPETPALRAGRDGADDAVWIDLNRAAWLQLFSAG